MIEQTSLDAFFNTPRVVLHGRRKLVFEALREGPANDRLIAERTGLPINCVTPRRGELFAKGIVVFDHEGPCPFSGNKSTFWRTDGALE